MNKFKDFITYDMNGKLVINEPHMRTWGAIAGVVFTLTTGFLGVKLLGSTASDWDILFGFLLLASYPFGNAYFSIWLEKQVKKEIEKIEAHRKQIGFYEYMEKFTDNGV